MQEKPPVVEEIRMRWSASGLPLLSVRSPSIATFPYLSEESTGYTVVLIEREHDVSVTNSCSSWAKTAEAAMSDKMTAAMDFMSIASALKWMDRLVINIIKMFTHVV
jgi:hypothetical protein